MPPCTSILDSVVHLTRPGSLGSTIDYCRNTLKFNCVTGGVHDDGLTENALIIFSDGSFVQFISFVHPVEYYPEGSPERAKRESHRWASLPHGWIAFANRGETPVISQILNERANRRESTIRFLPEKSLGRLTPRGESVKMLLTFPDPKTCPPLLPFFCGDDNTDRRIRVPCANEENKPSYEHPNEATGIAYIRALAAEEDLPDLAQEISTVLGSDPSRTGSTEIAWAFQTPKQEYILSSPQTEEEEQFYAERGASLYEVAFHTNIKTKGDVVFFCQQHGKMVFQTGR